MARPLSGLILVPFLFWTAGCQPRSESYEPVSGRESVAAPDFTLRDLKGERFSLSDFRGRVVFLDFWATWCPPCVVSAPQVDELSREYEDKGVEVISISLDTDEAPVRDFVRRANLSGRVALAGDSQIDSLYRISAVPSFFLIDKKGKVVNAWNGYHPSLISQWKSEFDRLLEQS